MHFDSFKPQHTVCNLQGCSDELQEAPTVLQCLNEVNPPALRKHICKPFPSGTCAPYTAAALLNVLKHTLHTLGASASGQLRAKGPDSTSQHNQHLLLLHTQLCSAGLHSSWRTPASQGAAGTGGKWRREQGYSSQQTMCHKAVQPGTSSSSC